MGSIPIGSATLPGAGVFRRLAALIYDTLLLAALWMTTTFVLVIARGGAPVPPGNPAYQLLLAAITAIFFIGFWLRGGQTLGMRAWRLRVETSAGTPLDSRTAIIRFAASLVSAGTLGAGLVWLWVDRDRLTWHDRWAGTRVVVVPKAAG